MNITCCGADLTVSADDSFGDLHSSGGCVGNKNLVGQQSSCNVSCGNLQQQFRGIAGNRSISPELRFTESLPDAITFSNRISPVIPLDWSRLHWMSVNRTRPEVFRMEISPVQWMFVNVVLPVVTETSKESIDTSSTRSLPVVTFTFRASCAEDWIVTSPVVIRMDRSPYSL